MQSVLLALALTTCVQNPDQCYTEQDAEDGKTLVTACGLAPDKSGRPITIEAVVEGDEYIVVLEPKCLNT